MATKAAPAAQKKKLEIVPDEPIGKKKGGVPLIVWIAAAVLAFIILVVLLHVSGALNKPEEAIYKKAAKNDILKVVLSPLHHPDFKEKLTKEDAIDVIQLRTEMVRAADIIKDQEDQISSLEKKAGKVGSLEGKLKKLEKKMKDLEEGAGAAPAATGMTSYQQPAASAAPAAAQPSAAALPAGTSRSINLAIQSKDYRKVSKIVDAMATDQAVDVLNTLGDSDVVEILVLLKDKKSAEIIQAMEPARAGQIFKLIMDRRGGA